MGLSRRQLYAYLAIAAVVVAIGVRYVVLPRTAGPADAGAMDLVPLASPSAQPAGPGSPGPAPDLVVYVCGAVRSPGVVRVPAGARVADALALAGGASAAASLDGVNLAAKVADGQQILVPAKGAAPPAGGSAAAPGSSASLPSAPININTATAEQLDALQGVGPATAQKIVDYRSANGPFKTIDDIKNVSGIGDAKFAAMKDSITV